MSIKIGTRGSQLALAQTKKVENLLRTKGVRFERVVVKSEGDIDRNSPLWEMGGKGAFTRRLERALLEKKIDLAVHSAKDLPVKLAEGTWIAGVLPRGSVEDVLVVRERVFDLQEFLSYATVATGSLRRRAFLSRFFGVKKFVDIRGNVDSRIKKLYKGDFDALVLARAGLERLGILNNLIWYKFDVEHFIPASNQGFIVVQARKGEFEDLFPSDHNMDCFWVEKEVSRLLELDCRTPAAFHCRIKNSKREFRGSIMTPDGMEYIDVEMINENSSSFEFAEQIKEEFLKKGAEKILERIRKWQEKLS